VLAAGAVGALVLAGATACASATKTVSVSSGGSSSGAYSVPATSASPSPSASASGAVSASASASASAGAGSTASNHPLIPSTGGPVITPKAQVSAAPAGTKLTAFESAAHSADGRKLYLGLESQGGACGQYNVVVQQTSSTVSVGLVHLSAGGVMCPMFVTHTLVVATLANPLDGRTVVDLANGQTVASPQIG